jgi:cytochrome d ubiquinol oxidase subunit II
VSGDDDEIWSWCRREVVGLRRLVFCLPRRLLRIPIVGIAALIGVIASARARRDGMPFALTTLFFVVAYLTLGVMFWPYMVPYSVTVANAAAPEASLSFFFYGGVIVLPVIAIYTIGVYRVFRGKGHGGYR